MSEAIDALSVVVGQQKNEELMKLRSENAKLEEALRNVRTCANRKAEYYVNLVWLARGQEGDDRLNNDRLRQSISELGCQDEFSRDVANLEGSEGDWHHGFNSGVLAASRLCGDMASATHDFNWEQFTYTAQQQREKALNEFPMLDT